MGHGITGLGRFGLSDKTFHHAAQVDGFCCREVVLLKWIGLEVEELIAGTT